MMKIANAQTNNADVETSGILYITYGSKYVSAAIHSAKTARKHSPDLSIHIFLDQKSFDEFGFSKDLFPFTSASILANPHRRSKVDTLALTPFDRTLYLDSDTSIAQDISSIFDILDRFDICAAQAMLRNSYISKIAWQKSLPVGFPPFNTGVILYRKTQEVITFFEQWSKAYAEFGHRHDQPTFRELLWSSKLRVIALPPEYNVRYLKYKFFWNKTEAVPFIYHLKQYHTGWLAWSIEMLKNSLITTIDLLSRPLRKLIDAPSIKDARRQIRIAKKETK